MKRVLKKWTKRCATSSNSPRTRDTHGMDEAAARSRRRRTLDVRRASHASTGGPDWRDGLPSSGLRGILTRPELDARDVANVVRVCRSWRNVLPKHAASRFLPERLEDDDAGVRRAALRALGALGEHAKEHAGAIAELLEHEDWHVRMAAVEALGALGEHAKEHVGAIAARLEDEDWDVRQAAAWALGALGEHAKEHVGAIVARLWDNVRC